MATTYKLERPDHKTPKLYETEEQGDSALVHHITSFPEQELIGT